MGSSDADRGFCNGECAGLDLVPDSGSLILRRHDGKEVVVPGFEFVRDAPSHIYSRCLEVSPVELLVT